MTSLKAIERKIPVKDTLVDCSVCLHDMITKIFDRMAEVDKILRGKGYPNSVTKILTKSFIEKNYSRVKPLIDAEIECPPQIKQKIENKNKTFNKQPIANINIEDMIRNLTIRYETDTEITIQEKGKQPIPISLQSLGFKNVGIVWNNFLKVLKTPPNYYWICSQDKDRKQIKVVSDRLIKWLSNNLKINFPVKYKLYEHKRAEKSGTYRFKFKIEYADIIIKDETSRETFRKNFFYTAEMYLSNLQDESLKKKIQEMTSEGLIKEFLEEKEIRQYFER